MCAQVCMTFCDSMNCSPTGSSVHGIFQTRILEQVAISWPQDQTHVSWVSCIGRKFLYHYATWAGITKNFQTDGNCRELICCCCPVSQSCPTLCNPMNWSMPGFPVLHPLLELINSYPLSQWCHPTISSSVIPFSSCLQFFWASWSFLISQRFASGGQILEAMLC